MRGSGDAKQVRGERRYNRTFQYPRSIDLKRCPQATAPFKRKIRYLVKNAFRILTVHATGFPFLNPGTNLDSRVTLAAAAPKLKPAGFSETIFTSVGLPAASTLT